MFVIYFGMFGLVIPKIWGMIVVCVSMILGWCIRFGGRGLFWGDYRGVNFLFGSFSFIGGKKGGCFFGGFRNVRMFVSNERQWGN